MTIELFLVVYQSQCTEFNTNKNNEQNQEAEQVYFILKCSGWKEGGETLQQLTRRRAGVSQSVAADAGRKEFQFSCCALLWIEWPFEWVTAAQLCFAHMAVWVTAAVFLSESPQTHLHIFPVFTERLCLGFFFHGFFLLGLKPEEAFFQSEVTFGRLLPHPANSLWWCSRAGVELGLRSESRRNENSLVGS